jgi:hypothetical protein
MKETWGNRDISITARAFYEPLRRLG